MKNITYTMGNGCKTSVDLLVLYKMGMNPVQPLIEFLDIHYGGHYLSLSLSLIYQPQQLNEPDDQ